MATNRKVAGTTDEELMKQLATGDPAPLGELYRRYATILYSLMHHVAPWLTTDDLEDLCQEVFLDTYKNAPRYQEQGKLRGYLGGIAVRRAREFSRRRWLRQGLLQRFFVPSQVDREEPAQSSVDMKDSLNQAIAALPVAQRQVLLFHVVDGLSTDEIATALGLKPNAVWTRLCRARQTVMEFLGRQP